KIAHSSSSPTLASSSSGADAAHWQILGAMLLATVLAAVLPSVAPGASGQLAAVCGAIGTVFVNALKMLVVPLIASSLIAAVGRLGEGGFGRLFGKLLLCISISSLAAALIGVSLVNLIEPGDGVGIAPPAAAARPEGTDMALSEVLLG